MFLLKRENWDTISVVDFQDYKGKVHDDVVKKDFIGLRKSVRNFTLFYELNKPSNRNGFKQGNCR